MLTLGAKAGTAHERAATSVPQSRCADWRRVALSYPGASALEVEQEVVLPVEEALREVRGVEHMVSTTDEGLASVWLASSSESTDRALIEALRRITSLPEQAERPVLMATPPPQDRLVIVVRGPRPQLDGVVDQLPAERAHTVEVRGQSPARLSVRLDPARLQAMGLHPSAVILAVEHAMSSTNLDLEALERVPLTSGGATPVRLADVAELRVDEDADGPWARAGDEAARVLLLDADRASSLPEEVAALRAHLPPGVHVATAGRIGLRGCPRPVVGMELEGDLALLDLELPPGTARAEIERVIDGVGAIDGAVWLRDQPVLDWGQSWHSGHVQLLLPADSPRRDVVAQALRQVPQLRGLGRHGRGRAHMVVELRHPDISRLHGGAQWLSQAIRERGMNSSSDLAPRPQMDVEIDREASIRHGLSVAEVAQHLRLLMAGRSVGEVADGPRRLQVFIEPTLPPDDPLSMAGIRSTTIRSRRGVEVPLSAVVELRLGSEDDRLVRRDGERVHHVHLWIAEDDRSATTTLVDEKLLPALAEAYPALRARRLPRARDRGAQEHGR